MARSRKLVPIATVPKGGKFEHYRDPYVRATKQEESRHPGQKLVAKRGKGKIVLAYMLPSKGQSGRTPVSFNADVRVVVTEGKK